jgi:two-component system nitrate/nitrite response regulator NarL
MSPLKIIIADDHSAVRKSLRLLMECELDIEVVAETTNGLDTIRAVQNLQPDLLLLDIKMPQMSGLEVLQYLRNEKHAVGIIVLSNHCEQLYVAAALRLGADAFITKSAGVEALMEAIQIIRNRVSAARAEALLRPAEVEAPRGGHLLTETRAELDQTRRKWSEAG